MREDGKSDEYDIKNQIRVLEETEDMFPLIRKQLRDGIENLRRFMEKNKDSIESSKHYDEASAFLRDER